MKAHELMHSGAKQFICDICNIGFTTNQGLKTHILSQHGSNPKFTCDICNKSFFTNFKLKQHLEVHTGSKNFACARCGKLFTRKDNMKTHMVKFCNNTNSNVSNLMLLSS